MSPQRRVVCTPASRALIHPHLPPAPPRALSTPGSGWRAYVPAAPLAPRRARSDALDARMASGLQNPAWEIPPVVGAFSHPSSAPECRHCEAAERSCAPERPSSPQQRRSGAPGWVYVPGRPCWCPKVSSARNLGKIGTYGVVPGRGVNHKAARRTACVLNACVRRWVVKAPIWSSRRRRVHMRWCTAIRIGCHASGHCGVICQGALERSADSQAKENGAYLSAWSCHRC